MAAIGTVKANSGEVVNNLSRPAPLNAAYTIGEVEVASAAVTAAAAVANGAIRMITLPAGKYRFLPKLSWLRSGAAGVASETVAVGHGPHINSAGSSVSGNDRAFLEPTGAGNGGVLTVLEGNTAAAGVYHDIDSARSPLDIYITHAGGAGLNSGATSKLAVAYVRQG